VKEREHLKDLGTDASVILKYILKKQAEGCGLD
jgi:hypothetical protein